MSKVKLEETENKRRLHIGSFFADLNESDYLDLIKIFSAPSAKQLLNKKPARNYTSSVLQDFFEQDSLPIPFVRDLFNEGYQYLTLHTKEEFDVWLNTKLSKSEIPNKATQWFKPSHRPPYNTGHHLNFSISVLLYSPKMETHTVGWFDFELDKWSYEAGEEYTDFVWTNLPTP